MLADIAAHTTLAQARIGKSALDERVMAAIASVPRHRFVPVEIRRFAYLDQPLPIGFGKTISQPFIVALMTDLLEPQPQDRVLEVGSGLGYQAAVLAKLVARVYSVEIIAELAEQAARRLKAAGVRGVEIRVANGYYGWPEQAPFDKIIVTAAPQLVPPPLLAQLKPGGRMVIPAGLPDSQQLMLVEKSADGRIAMREILPVRFSAFEEEAEL
ncbi:MAG: protein-L-isoaspartate(D-aspartate) O-methyltransferase [Burkholderiales bacterium]|nr:protein-L-isoaspartate(D-aspartate) O-methyltransferase [Burkholderiales bacterium]